MALYRTYQGSVWGPTGNVEWELEFDDAGTPEDESDDDLINLYYRNPNPVSAALVITSKRSGQTRSVPLEGNNPEWVLVEVPPQFAARRGQLTGTLMYPGS